MSDVGRNINGAFDKGYEAYTPGAPSFNYHSYKARHMIRAFKAGWAKARAERLELFSDKALDAGAVNSSWVRP